MKTFYATFDDIFNNWYSKELIQIMHGTYSMSLASKKPALGTTEVTKND